MPAGAVVLRLIGLEVQDGCFPRMLCISGGWLRNSLELAKYLLFFMWLLSVGRAIRLLMWWLAFPRACVSKESDGSYQASYSLALKEIWYHFHCIILKSSSRSSTSVRGEAAQERKCKEFWFIRGSSLKTSSCICLDEWVSIQKGKDKGIALETARSALVIKADFWKEFNNMICIK